MNIDFIMTRTKIWWEAARWEALPQSAIACAAGGLIAFYHGKFDLLRFLVTFAGVMAVHLGTNLLDDYADLKIGGFSIRNEVKQAGNAVRALKAPYVVDGTIKLQHVLYVSLGLFALGVLAGAYLTAISGWPVAAIAAAGAFFCFFYSMPPVKLCYRGMGEATVALSFAITCVGTYYAVAQSFSWEPVLISAPIGIMVSLILYVHSIMDFKPDLAVKKRTLVMVLGNQQKAVQLLPLALVISYGSIIGGVAVNILPLTTLLTLLSIPLAVKLVQLMRRLSHGDYEVRRTWWMGPMERGLMEVGQWFMIRWYLARNLMVTTTLLIFVAYIMALVL